MTICDLGDFFYITETQTDDKTKNKISLLARRFKSLSNPRALFIQEGSSWSVFKCCLFSRILTNGEARPLYIHVQPRIPCFVQCDSRNRASWTAKYCVQVFVLEFSSHFFHFSIFGLKKKKVKKGVQTRVNRVWRRRINESFFMLFTQQLIWLSIFFALILFLKTHKMNCLQGQWG